MRPPAHLRSPRADRFAGGEGAPGRLDPAACLGTAREEAGGRRASMLGPVVLLCALQVGALPLAAQVPPVVQEVELRSDAPLERAGDLRSLVVVEPGEPLRDEDVRRTVRNLYASGVASEVEIWARTVPGGVSVTVALWANVLVEEVVLAGELSLKSSTLRREIVQREAEPLVEDRILRSVYRLQDRYRDEGFLAATVRARPTVDPARKRAVVTFEVDAGRRAVVGEVSVTGDLGEWQPQELKEPLKVEPGAPYRRLAVEQDVERLRRWLIRRGFRLADVELESAEHDPETAEVSLRYRVEVGPRVEVVVLGADLEEMEKKGLLPFLGDEGYDEALVLQAVERLRRHFQEKGHYQVQIERQEEQREGTLLLTLQIRPGPVFTLQEVRFEGNESVPSAELEEFLDTVPRRLFLTGTGRLVEETLASDLENIRGYYALRGWTRVRVGPERVEVRGDGLILIIPIEEGPRSRVVALHLEGVESANLDELRQYVSLYPGGPFHPQLLEETVGQVLAFYEEGGYSRAQIATAEDWNPEHNLVEITLRVLEGPRMVADRVIVRGNYRTRTELVRRVTGLVPGEPLSQRRLLAAQRSLYGLGVFSRVQVELAPAPELASQRDVVVRLEEGRTQRVLYGLGYDSEVGIGGLLGYSHANLGGRAVQLQLDARTSRQGERYRLLLRRPGAQRRFPVATGFTLFREDEVRPGFEADQRGAQVELSRRWRYLYASVFFDYRLVDSRQLAGSTQEIEREFQNIQISSLIPRLVWDRRDDPVDPRRGWQSTLQLQYAFPSLQAEEEFLKLFVQQSAYLDLKRFGVLGGSVRVGGIEPLSDRAIPIAERFFAGGRTTHRAYRRDFLGIPGETLDEDGDPLGGNGLLLVNLGYRVPVVGAFWGTVFVDAGNVWPDWRDIDLEGIKLGAGVGVRYLSPVGPVRLEVGWKLDREPGESPTEIFFSFGNAF